VILWNETQAQGNFLILDLRGAGKNRDAIGAHVVATVGGRCLVRTVCGGGSYISSHDRRVHLGLGDAMQADQIEVHWPDGQVETRNNVRAGSVLIWTQMAKSLVP
jgi:hypothetical protein